MKPRPMVPAVAALLTVMSVGCNPEPRSGHLPAPIVVCGTTLYGGVGAFAPLRLRPVSGGQTEKAPRRSVLPPAATASPLPGGEREVVVTGGCATAPVVTVSPTRTVRTLVVAYGTNGGVAGLTLAVSRGPVTIRAYQNGRLVGKLVILDGIDSSP